MQREIKGLMEVEMLKVLNKKGTSAHHSEETETRCWRHSGAGWRGLFRLETSCFNRLANHSLQPQGTTWHCPYGEPHSFSAHYVYRKWKVCSCLLLLKSNVAVRVRLWLSACPKGGIAEKETEGFRNIMSVLFWIWWNGYYHCISTVCSMVFFATWHWW